MDGKADHDDDVEEEEAATGTPVLELNVGHYRQITRFIYTKAHTIMHKHTLESAHVFFFFFLLQLCDSDTHTRAGSQMNQLVNTKCLLSERFQNKSCFQLLPLPLASTLIFALGTCRRSRAQIDTNGCKYQGMVSVSVFCSHSHTCIDTHIHTHLFTMVISCSRERTSVAARPW